MVHVRQLRVQAGPWTEKLKHLTLLRLGRKELFGRIAIAVALDTEQRVVRDVALSADGGLKRS